MQTRRNSKSPTTITKGYSSVREIITSISRVDQITEISIKQKIILYEVFDCIKKASSFGGKVFGGFVRDIIVPNIKGSREAIIFKDVDIWFKTNKAADEFLSSMRFISKQQTSLLKVNTKNKPKVSLGTFSKQYCLLVKYGISLASFDIIVAETLPVDDFDVNTVTYSLSQDDKWITDSPNYLIDQIAKKKAIMLYPYFERIQKAKEQDSLTDKPYLSPYYEARINRIFIFKGWNVLVPYLMNHDFFVLPSL